MTPTTTQAVAPVLTICLVSELRLPHFASIEVQLVDECGEYVPKIGDKLVPITTLSALQAEVVRLDEEAQSIAIHADAIQAERDALEGLCAQRFDMLAEMAGELDALRGRLEELAAKWERQVLYDDPGQGSQEANDGYDDALTACATELRTITTSSAAQGEGE